MNDLAAGRVDGEESSPSTLTDAVQSARQAAATGTAASGEQVATSAAEIPLSGEGDGDLKATASAKAKNPSNRNQRENASSKKKRGVCPRCDRPSLSACICEALPASAARIELQRSHCFVLQHPHERKCKNRSLPFVELCLDPGCITVSVGRRFKNNCSASSDDDPAATMQHKLLNNDKPVWLLSPREGAISLTQAINERQNKEQKITVLVLDGTWKVCYDFGMQPERVLTDAVILCFANVLGCKSWFFFSTLTKWIEPTSSTTAIPSTCCE